MADLIVRYVPHRLVSQYEAQGMGAHRGAARDLSWAIFSSDEAGG